MLARFSFAVAMVPLITTLPGVGATIAMAGNSTATEKWWLEPFNMFQTNLREIDADMDADAVADFIVRHGANAWLTSVGGILANYPTDLDFQIRNPYLQGDLIQDSLDAAAARGLRVLARMDFSKVQLSVAEKHPEWLYISPNGTWQNHTNGLVSVCPSGEWYQDKVFEILDEVITRYPSLAGFFVNWAGMNERDYFRVYHGVCHCSSCQAGWRSRPTQNSTSSSDNILPTGPESPTYAEWKTWSDGLINTWTGKVQSFLSTRLPTAGLILGESADVMFYEANNAVGRDTWPSETSQTASRFISHRPAVPVLVNCASFLDHGYRFAAEEQWHYVQYHLQAMARGANPSTYIIGVPGKVPWGEGLDAAGEVMRFRRNNVDVYKGLRPVAKTALVLPQSSQMEAGDYAVALAEYKGLYRMLQELHMPFDVVGQQNIARMEGISRYSLIVLPNLGQLRDTDASKLNSWADDGGIVLATGAIGTLATADNSTDLQLSSLPAAQRISHETDQEALWSLYFAPEQNGTANNTYTGPILPLLGSYSLYEWKSNTTSLYRKLGYAPFAPPEYIYGNQQTEERAAGFGPQGALVTFPIGWAYHEIGMSVFRDFFELVMNRIGVVEDLEFELWPQVEVTVNRNRAGELVVHLINMSGARGRNFGQHLPIPAGKIKIGNGGQDVKMRTLVTNMTLEVEQGVVGLPGINLFEVVVVQGL
ncbi:hypothetical protein PspLS_10844 [Pyricularia sp. CBS 133598]|nr:hypothetical protein PspLS_10844 [Pyricularia sp. CBS 133598]